MALFGGNHTGVAPPDLPEGLSPDCQDLSFVPGGAFSRPCLSAIFNPPLPGGAETVYQKTYITPDGTPLNLVMDSNGVMYVENVAASPGTATSLFQVASDLSALSASAFGREYIAISDLLHGEWCPLQYDGTFVDRVTQDGPGAPPTASNIAPPAATLQNTGAGTVYTVVSLTPSDPIIHTRYNHITMEYEDYTIYTTLTIVTSAPNVINTGTIVAFAGVTPSSFDTSRLCTVALSNTTFKTRYYSGDPTTGSGGTATIQNPSLIRSGNIVSAVTSAPHGFQAGSQVQIGIASTSIGGGVSAISRDGNGVVTVTTTDPHGLPIGANIFNFGRDESR